MTRMKMISKYFLLLAVLGCITSSWAGNGPGGPGGNTSTVNEDTSFAEEYSDSCLSGGCHETDQRLVDEYADSFMTHVMVKCNACHGTHTAETVGKAKLNLTGYVPGIGATGYHVGRDRCLVCHNNQHPSGRKAVDDCISCHSPHAFK